jgi:2-amino-4-hydroxy-6-hydroxymethyldihydropteridine diphosphokinase
MEQGEEAPEVPHRAFIGFGSNLGDRKANISEALGRIGEIPNTRVVRTSSLYESEPHGDAKTWFVNGVAEIETEQKSSDLLKRLKAIEEAMGRKRVKGKRWGSRIIDLDILFFDSEVVDSRNLKLPHPEIPGRRFVLLPLAEVAPQLTHPVLGQTVSQILASSKDKKRVTLLPPGA